MTDPTGADPNPPDTSTGGSGEPAPIVAPPAVGAQAPAPAPGVSAAPPVPPAPTSAAPAASAWAPSSQASAPAGGTAAARPTGITILSILAAIGGILGLFGGFVVLLAGTAIFGGAGALLGIAALAYAGLLLAAAYGFWTLQPWAWPLGVAVAIFGIVVSILYILGGQSIVSQALSIIVDGAILYYLNQPTIRQLFGR
jgi:hypothetical protein